MNLKYSLLSVPLMLALTALPALAGTAIDKTVAVAANGNVRISSVSGSIKITTWDRNQVHVGGTLSNDAKRLEVEKSATGVTIKVVLPHNSWGNLEGSHLVVQVPATSRLHVGTVSADISAAGLVGPVKLQTVSGEITLQSQSAKIETRTVSGDIEVTGSAPKSEINVQTISGEVKIKNIRGKLQAQTVSGDIETYGDNAFSSAELGTTSGDAKFSGALATTGDYEFRSVSGDIELRLPAIPSASFEVSSLSGDIDPDFGPKPQRTSEYGPGKEWHYQHGSGKAEVRIHTMSGDITIRADHK